VKSADVTMLMPILGSSLRQFLFFIDPHFLTEQGPDPLASIPDKVRIRYDLPPEGNRGLQLVNAKL
jgi:hypothetical protein